MDENQNQFCNLCKRHCPVNNLQCIRGQSYYAQKQEYDCVITEATTKNSFASEATEKDTTVNEVIIDRTKINSTKIIKEDRNMNNDLMSLLYQSSHFLHHRRGGKRGQRRILTLLAQNPGISQKELQDRLGIESGSMSELVIKLEHKGLIIRAKDETDKRMSNLTITDRGLELSKELEDLASEDEKLLLGSLNTEEQEQLKLLLSKLVTSWEEAEELREDGHHHKRCCHSGDHDQEEHHGGCGHHGHGRDQDRRGHHFSGKDHDKPHHHRHN